MDMGEALHNNVEQMPPRRGFGRIAAHLDDSPVNIALRDCRRGVQQFSVLLISTTNANTKPHPCPCPQPSPMSVPRASKPAVSRISKSASARTKDGLPTGSRRYSRFGNLRYVIVFAPACT